PGGRGLGEGDGARSARRVLGACRRQTPPPCPRRQGAGEYLLLLLLRGRQGSVALVQQAPAGAMILSRAPRPDPAPLAPAHKGRGNIFCCYCCEVGRVASHLCRRRRQAPGSVCFHWTIERRWVCSSCMSMVQPSRSVRRLRDWLLQVPTWGSPKQAAT